MKMIPNAIARKLASQTLKLGDRAPSILFGSGLVGMVGSTVLACRATLKLEEVLDMIELNRATAVDAKNRIDSTETALVVDDRVVTYSDKEFKHDMVLISARGMGSLAKLYAPSVILGAASVVCLTKSHHILKERNLALTAAYAAVDGAFKNYRSRVVEKYGEDVDRELTYEYADVNVVDPETGEITGMEERVVGAPGASYWRWHDEESSRSWSSDPDVNMAALRSAQNWANDRLVARGHVFLNEVFELIGLAHTKAGSMTGWLYRQGTGDDVIDFGLYEGTHKEFDNGRPGAILLNFNVDGPIYDKLPEEHIR